jgi:outer membrane protein OmpA-like peptidoglycan-associated protein
MKKFLAISVLCGLAGCADMGGAPPGPPPPATPVFFQPFSAALDPAATNTIAAAAQAANAQPNARVVVIGAADSVGSVEANKYLSETRAQVVADALVADGVAEGRIHMHGVGVAPSPAPTGMPAQFARRVLIEIGG